MGRFFRFGRAPVTGTLLAVIFAMFGVEWYSHALDNNAMLYRLGAISRDLITDHQYWRAITGMFLHGSPLHVLANTFSLWQLGTLYEAMFGSKRFAFIYFTTGIIASFASAMFMPARQISVGASGAVLGIVGAFIFSILRSPQFRHERWARGIIQQLLFWVGVNLLMPLVIPNLDNTAHIAGLMSGLLLGFIPHRVPPPPPGDAVIDV
jgi:rhomboid protease GluP